MNANNQGAQGVSATGPTPELHHIQPVLDRLAPRPTTATNMRWSSVFRISHRLVNRYAVGRVFLAGDAAHIHPPTGAQGMNTGLQDAFNLGWKLALAVHGLAAPALLDTYHTERHPIGEEVVGRTVRAAREGIGAGESSLEAVLMREAQLLVGYPDSPIVGEDDAAPGPANCPRPGMRAPDAAGLRQDSTTIDVRCHELFRHPDHTLLLWATAQAAWRRACDTATAVDRRTSGLVRPYIVVPPGCPADLCGRTFSDSGQNFATAYGFGDAQAIPAACLIRPDGYISYRSSAADLERLLTHLRATLLFDA